MRDDYDHLRASLDDVTQVYDSSYREGCPVSHMDTHGGYYLFADHATVRAAAADWETFSSAGGVTIPRPPIRPAAIAFDPPEHKFWRDIYNEVLSVTATRAFEQHIVGWAIELIEKFASRGDAELVAELATVLPAMTIMHLIGISDPDRIDIAVKVGHDIMQARNPQEQGAALDAFFDVCRTEIADRRARPRDDFLTRLAVGDTARGDCLTDMEIINVLVGFYTAGHHTTASALASLLDHIARDPALRDALIADDSLIPKAAEEAIRLHTPLHAFFRQATSDVECGGVAVPAGSEVMLSFASANRDPTVFAEPTQFRLDRRPNPHMGFGHGIHVCVGARLARLEIRIVVEQLLARLPDLAHSGEDARWLWIGGNLLILDRVPIVFTAAA